MTTALDSTAAPDVAPPSTRRRRFVSRMMLAFVLGLAAALAVGVGALAAYDQQYQGRVLPGVHVGSLDLSGMTSDQAAARLHQQFDGFTSGTVVIAVGDQQVRVPFAAAQRRPDVEAMVGRAMSVGRAGNPVERAIADARTALRGVDIGLQVTYDRAALTRLVTSLAVAHSVLPVDAAIARTTAGYSVTPSVAGRQADPSSVLASLTSSLGRVDAPSEIKVALPLVEVPPAITTDEADTAVTAANRIAADIRIVDGSDSWVIPAATVRTWISFSEAADGTEQPIVDPAKVATTLTTTVAKDVLRAARSATFTVQSNALMGVTPAVNGRALDTTATAAKVGDLLAARASAGPTTDVPAVLTVTEPAVSTAQALAAAPKMREISRWTTPFFIGLSNNFGANIWIPTLDIDGTVVGPGETFDFWNAVGPISRARGYGDGGAIINGKTEPQGALAGGICSTSTTLFNAALLGGFKMGARANHYYYIDRYPLGLDATVFKSSSGSVQTMSWTNDTPYPVLIRGYKIRDGGKGYVRFVLYSVPNGRKVVVSDPIVKNPLAATDTVVYTSTLAPGVEKRVEYPVDGKDVWRTVTVYDNGTIIHQTTYYSHYARITGVKMIGGPAPAPTP
ncbi:MAG: VanW family protein [Candidatus Limnocylindrales bacterium]